MIYNFNIEKTIFLWKTVNISHTTGKSFVEKFRVIYDSCCLFFFLLEVLYFLLKIMPSILKFHSEKLGVHFTGTPINLKTPVHQEIWRTIWKTDFIPINIPGSLFIRLLSIYYLMLGPPGLVIFYALVLFFIHVFIPSQSPKYLILSSCSANDGSNQTKLKEFRYRRSSSCWCPPSSLRYNTWQSDILPFLWIWAVSSLLILLLPHSTAIHPLFT